MTDANRLTFRQIHRETGVVRHCGITRMGGDWGSTPPMGSTDHWTDPEQSTGLTDKNGVEIFEGDVVRVCGFTANKTVVWSDDWAAWIWQCETGQIGNMNGGSAGGGIMEVIGNIHQHKELLTEGK